jgi:3-phenylpropionate/trans-cinnamate dioxygenase ferredoxin subunit
MRRIELTLDTIPEDTLLRVDDGGAGIVVVRSGDQVAAYEDVCPHARWRLSDGELVNGLIECPGHGWEFDPDSGRCVTVPAYCLKPVSVTRQGRSVTLVARLEPAPEAPAAVGADDPATV